MLEHAEVQRDDDPDEELEDQDELALRDQVRLAGLVDQLGDRSHRLVHGHVLEPRVDRETEQESEGADHQPADEERAAGNAEKRHRIQVRNDEIGFTAGGLLQ